MLIIFAIYLYIYLFIFNKVFNNTHMKVDKFGIFKENTIITRKMWYIYLYFFFMCGIYGYLFFYEFFGFSGYNFFYLNLNLNEVWFFCWVSTSLNYLFYTFCLIKELDKIDLLYRRQFFFLTFLVAYLMYKYRFCVLCVYGFLLVLEILFIFIFSWANQLGILEDYPMLFTRKFRNFFVKKPKV